MLNIRIAKTQLDKIVDAEDLTAGQMSARVNDAVVYICNAWANNGWSDADIIDALERLKANADTTVVYDACDRQLKHERAALTV
jgi:hypothetical protein